MTDPAVPSRVPAGATSEGDGVVVGRGPVRVDAFIDFLCPYCRRFELSAGQMLGDLVADGRISLVHHPMGWPPYVTERAVALGVEGTPTVLVAGAATPADAQAIATAVARF
jgi:protein-disulfide isomerase